jgi:hypothetical protein
MKIRILVILVVLALCLGIGLVYAQEEPKDQMYYVLDVVVSPAKAKLYENAHKALMSAHAQEKYPFGYACYLTDDFHYLFIIPIANFADVDNLFKAEGAFQKKIGEDKYQGLMKGFAGTFEYLRTAISTVRADLSFSPQNPRLKPEEVKYFTWNYWYIENGKEQELEGIWKEFKSLYQKNNINDGWAMWVGGVGVDNPYHVGALFARSNVDFFTRNAEIEKTIGPKMMQLWNRALSLCRKFEQRTGVPRPDLSYAPKKE